MNCDRNYRQGISVITAEDLLIENCVLQNTAGTAPAAGIDFEPNLPRERLVHCVMRNCRIENNQGLALHVYARTFDGATAPMSIRVEDCITRGSNARSASLVTSCGPNGPVPAARSSSFAAGSRMRARRGSPSAPMRRKV